MSRGKSLKVSFYLFSSLLKQATSPRSLLALLSWLCSQQTQPSHPHGSANIHKRHKREDGNEEFGHTTVSLQENHSWERPFLPEQQLGQINQQQDDLKDHPLLLQEPFHTGICRFSGKLHLTQKACQTPPSSSSSSSCWRKRLRCCMEITQALGACGCK